MEGIQQVNRGYARSVVAISLEDGEATYFESVRSCAKYLGRNPAAVTKVCQGVWHTCNNHRLLYEEDYEKEFGKILKDWEE
tara:strand:+ start:686 stop:928 length:243 start_codon:yes stop_codon:yes gene_type:complete